MDESRFKMLVDQMRKGKIDRRTFFARTAALGMSATAFSQIMPASAQDSEEGTPVSGGTYRTALSEEPDQLDPAQSNQLTSSTITGKIYDNLVYIGEDGLPKPWSPNHGRSATIT